MTQTRPRRRPLTHHQLLEINLLRIVRAVHRLTVMDEVRHLDIEHERFLGSRYIIIPGEKRLRLRKYRELLPRFLEAKALAFSSDYNAMEAINFFFDEGIMVPNQISVTGYDDSVYASMVRPKLTTVHQDVPQKAHVALKRLLKLIQGETLDELNIKNPVYLVKRDSVRE